MTTMRIGGEQNGQDQGSERQKTILRKERIVALIEAETQTTVDALAERFDVSKETIRRDLTDLADRGLIRKVHGGATVPHRMVEPSFQMRMTENTAAKRRIAETAAALFQAGDTLFIDAGSTTLIFAEALSRQSGITVITNSIDIAQVISRNGSGNRAFLIGGELAPANSETIGALATRQIAQFQASHVVLTVGGISATGIMDFDLNEAEVAQAMIAQGQSLTVLADSSKFGRTALFKVAHLGKIARLIADASPPPALATALKQAGVEIHVASATNS